MFNPTITLPSDTIINNEIVKFIVLSESLKYYEIQGALQY